MPGRKRKSGKRHPSGDIRQPTKAVRRADITSVAKNQPHRKGNGSALMGYCHGRLWATRQIDRRQHEAAEAWMTRTVLFMTAIVGRTPNVPSIAAEMTARGLSLEADPDPERIAAIKANFEDLQDALLDAGLITSAPLLTRVTVSNRDMAEHELGDLRAALNVIANRLRIPRLDEGGR